MLSRRLISAFIIISVILLLLRLDFWLGTPSQTGRPGLVLCLLAALLAMIAASELVQMWPRGAQRPSSMMVIGGTLVAVAISFAPAFLFSLEHLASRGPGGQPAWWLSPNCFVWSFAGIVVAFLMSCGWEMIRFGRSVIPAGTVTDRLGRCALVYLYLSLLFGFLVPHRLIEYSNSIGLISLIALIATVKLSDSFAYFAGKSLGTIQLAPKLSPKKTVQGAVGALIGGCLAAAIVVFLVAPLVFGVTISKPWWWFLMYGTLVTVAGMVGDLAESMLKRDADCKDSGNWLPGLGGVLDVLDSLIFAAPVSYLLWTLV